MQDMFQDCSTFLDREHRSTEPEDRTDIRKEHQWNNLAWPGQICCQTFYTWKQDPSEENLIKD
eukprot:m.809144 g.809144  ORF g.809144 m.809144 type:complete len:63 (-) comp23383_c0_seq2:140-328(-)